MDLPLLGVEPTIALTWIPPSVAVVGLLFSILKVR